MKMNTNYLMIAAAVLGLATGCGADDKVQITVVGEVQRPGLYDVSPSVGVVGALAAAGWTTKNGNETQILVLRHPLSEKPEKHILDIRKVMPGDERDLRLQEGDRIVVPSKLISF